MKRPLTDTLELSKEEMLHYGHTLMEAIVNHFETQSQKPPVAQATRKEMDNLFQEDAPEQASNPMEVLNFVLENVMTKSNIVSHPKSFSFVPGPSNFISAMGDALASGFNIFSGGWAASPAAAELE
ncbi:MAG TPA: decarboxylase, partial [Flavobacteriaceae bacterium]|nr:decarboxylase [Flavobacteriaceae bacterium]